MARLTFDQIKEKEQAQNKTEGNKKYNKKFPYFFSLKDNGDTAIVRFPYKSTDEFDIITVHDVLLKPEDKFTRHVNCLREANEPLDKCPLCKAGVSSSDRFFVKMIEYVTDKDGKIVVEPRIWDKGSGFAKELNKFLNNYGDLSTMIFKIRRNGKKGDTGTRYEITAVDMRMYEDSIYPKDFSSFEDYSLFGFFIHDKNVEELNKYLETKVMPMPEKKKKEDTKPEQSEKVIASTPETMNTANNAGNVTESEKSAQSVVRARRTYNY